MANKGGRTYTLRGDYMENSLLYDWLTFSLPDFSEPETLAFLHLPSHLSWQTGLGSRLFYQQRRFFSGISVHSTFCSSDPDQAPCRLNAGCCVEMSGQGCRAYETYSGESMADLVARVRAAGFSVSRVDIAYDDFSGVIDLQHMSYQAQHFQFTSRLQARKIVDASEFSDLELSGLTVSHGSKSSRIFIRCYDKRVERNAFNIFPHWVRFEIQLRDENAIGFLDCPGDLGSKFSGLIRQYLLYRDPVPGDTNKRRWPVSSWWEKFLGDAAAFSVASKKDLDYNKDRFDAFVYDHMHNVIQCAVLCDGPLAFLRRVFGFSEDMPSKYQRLVSQFSTADPHELQRFLDLLSAKDDDFDTKRN